VCQEIVQLSNRTAGVLSVSGECSVGKLNLGGLCVSRDFSAR
jgi:hypothetical protein